MASYTLHIQYVDRPAETRTITQHKLTIGRDAGDIVLHDSQVSGRHAEIDWDGTTLKFVDLGKEVDKSQFLPWKVSQATTKDGKTIALGTDIGPMAICYRKDLFEKAGLETDRAKLAEQWKGDWAKYVALGKDYFFRGELWISTAPAMAILLTVLGFHLLGDALLERLEERGAS